jgi:hypothetical protein
MKIEFVFFVKTKISFFCRISRRTRANPDSRSYGVEKSWFRQIGGLCGIISRRTLFRLAAMRTGRNNHLEGLTRIRTDKQTNWKFRLFPVRTRWRISAGI